MDRASKSEAEKPFLKSFTLMSIILVCIVFAAAARETSTRAVQYFLLENPQLEDCLQAAEEEARHGGERREVGRFVQLIN